MTIVELLNQAGFSDTEQKFDVIPHINDKRAGAKPVLRKGDSREVGHYRSLLFRRKDTPVFVDTMFQQIWTPERLKSGRPIKFLNQNEARELSPDKSVDEVNFDLVMQTVAE